MKLNIVVVDDETPICEWLIYCIRKASPDYEVFSASNGEDAYALILERKPNVVFTDIRMPGMDGLELMRRVLELLPFTVFAVLTNYAEFSYAKQALSLGAREYFLKSELRGADIEAFLTSVMERAAAITAQKTQDTLPSGCIDLFNLYQQQEQPGYAGRFWKNQGMAEGMPYGLLCVASSGTTQETWQPPVALCRALTHENSLLYAEVATERGRLYLVLQAPDSRALAALITRAGTGLRRCSGLGVGESSSATGLDCFPVLAKQSALAANAFFFGGSDIIRFETLSSRPPLDRQVLRTGKGTILALMAQHRYDQATALTGDWFDSFARTGSEDIDWAIDYCRRMVLAVEERYYQQTNSPAQTMEIQASLSECRARCLALLEQMKTLYSGKCSPSIETALHYIHEHYREEISMAEVARQVYRSPEYFSRQFKEEVGENFSVYLTLYRLDRAQELLQHTGLRIAEVAEQVGYTTPGYFSRLYKKYKGLAPEAERGSKS